MSTSDSVVLVYTPSCHEQESPPQRSPWIKFDFSFMLTNKFLIILLLGQFLSLCITSTIVTTAELKINIPTTQTFFTYFVLFITCTPFTISKYGFKGFLKMVKNDSWKWNYFSVRSFEYTSTLSLMLLDAWTTPMVAVLSIMFLKVRYRFNQYLGIFICIIGSGMVIWGDIDIGKSMYFAKDPIRGDLFALIGATCYGISNVLEEYCVNKKPLYEVLGQMGLWGTFISIIQIVILELDDLKNLVLTSRIIGLIIAYTIAMLFLYVGISVFLRLSSALFFNLSLLTSDFYTLIFNYFIIKEPMSQLYPIAFCGTLLGLIIYYINPEDKPIITQENNNEPVNDTILIELDTDNKLDV
ncbi:21307_t:CDS:2 [Dentiscutata erythropus]|uniref:21307_t:CDS:1 n=1 Tax=Dentiscutata erythropus TaxID=1348616 RepID=A0A9N9BIM9_9GLOM|nr:21307_t:CDS:2 [Dentiscutata erythropus]